MIEEGKDKLEWTRQVSLGMMMVIIFLMHPIKIQALWGWRNIGRLQVDPAKLNTLKELIAGPDYKDNMQKIIRTIYEFAFMTYAGTTE